LEGAMAVWGLVFFIICVEFVKTVDYLKCTVTAMILAVPLKRLKSSHVP